MSGINLSLWGGSFAPAVIPVIPGTLWSWGHNSYGKLGVGDTVNKFTPTQIGAGATWSKMASGGDRTSAIKSNGTLWSWGYNSFGQLGDNTNYHRSSPVQVGALTNWSNTATQLAANFSSAIKTDGTLWMWGNNSYGEHGRGSKSGGSTNSPVQVGLLTTWLNVSLGQYHTAATKTDGTLWTWGANNYGQLGHNNTIYRSSPVQVGALTNWSTVTCNGTGSILAIKSNGTLWSWGRNNFGQLGQNDAIFRSSPVQVGALTNWSGTASATWWSLASKTDGTLWSWGYNPHGQLGHNDRVYKSSPVQVGSGTTWSKIGAGSSHGISSKTDGTLWSWGWNGLGQGGTNDGVAYRSLPVQVGSGTTWTVVGSGDTYSIAIQS